MGYIERCRRYREKAERCRRLANAIINTDDPVVANLLTLAAEFDAKASGLEAEEAAEALLMEAAN